MIRWLAAAALVAVALTSPALVATAGSLAIRQAATIGQSMAPEQVERSHSKPPSSTTSAAAQAGIPRHYLALYRKAGRGERWGRYQAWAVLAGIGKVESDHGRSSAPGIRSGVNRFGCCAGPMQFNLRNGPPSTWDTYGHGSPYRATDAIPAARRLLLANGARRHLDRAIWNYNHSWSYVAEIKRLARSYQTRRSA